MILSDHTIRQYLERDRLVVEPEPTEEQIQPASLDVRLGGTVYDPRRDVTSESLETITLLPQAFVLCETKDWIELPFDVAAQLTGRSSIGRQGVIVHCTAGFIDPGFRGKITLEMYNVGTEKVTFDVGERIAQLVFFQLDQMSTGYDGQYQDQQGPQQ